MEEKIATTTTSDLPKLAVAPMIDWTDRHCRFFHRQITRRSMVYTEMIVDRAIIHGPRARLLRRDAAEHPVALQVGGSDPATLAQAVQLAAPFGYDQINLNVGCPSDRVQLGCFGAVLMKDPALVARCLSSMIEVAEVPVTVKCRIGVDDQDPEVILPDFLSRVQDAGVTQVTIHARKAWLQGLSPKENRDIPPLDYDLVLRMKARFPDIQIALNGGVKTLAEAQDLLGQGLDGVMVGRAAYHEPMAVLGGADALWGEDHAPDAFGVVQAMRPYIAAHLADGGKLNQITRHMLGLFAGRPGARTWRRMLSEGAARPGADLDLLDAALEEMTAAA
ncbi:tRNA dihydrouridine(20/20a) synthase DusA [Falsirhodobacter deserti]|uniref:tRNA dihydrouridine(20/20a) synthase DusA n=1 Tax=Falsirhodobacter deserti TaxID=1365611 RepID=UPI000FE38B01|nr:tRNA dihydrouridine(20/20a) synthase DusA [Falsirhodobacter deserti]